MNKIKVMSIFGTRPEAIKMAPVVKALENDDMIESIVCVTAQHREMLDQVLDLFDIKPNFDLDIMKSDQTLSEITSRMVMGLDPVIKEAQPHMILVHGDTTTTFSAALSAFYNDVKVGHVEAGLRSGDKYSPYPEEMNRTLTARIADIHFAPTSGNISNLRSEGVCNTSILKTGNTVIDALKDVIREDYVFDDENINNVDFKNKKVVLLTSHRRENIGQPMESIFAAIKEIALANDDSEIIFPMHLNPRVREIAFKHMSKVDNIHLVEPLEYEAFANLINKSYLVLTDSGGIQEEAPALGKPVLVLRTETERPEAVYAGTVKMVGIDKNVIIEETNALLRSIENYNNMSEAINPYGDGMSSKRIVDGIKEYFK